MTSMENDFLHVFALQVEGTAEPFEFSMSSATADAADAVDAFTKYVARQEDNFLPVGETIAVRASRIWSIRHLRCEPSS